MKRLLLSFTLILGVWCLNGNSVGQAVSQSDPPKNLDSQSNNVPIQKPATSRKDSNANQRGTKDNPVFVDVIKPAQTDAETARIEKEHNEKLELDGKTFALNQKAVQLNEEVVAFTGILACVAILQLVVLGLQVRFNHKQVRYFGAVERAYVFVQATQEWDIQPSISSSEVSTIVHIKFSNCGKTPAITKSTED